MGERRRLTTFSEVGSHGCMSHEVAMARPPGLSLRGFTLREKRCAATAAVRGLTVEELIGDVSVHTWQESSYFIPYTRVAAVQRAAFLIHRALREQPSLPKRLAMCTRLGLEMSYRDSPHHKEFPTARD